MKLNECYWVGIVTRTGQVVNYRGQPTLFETEIEAVVDMRSEFGERWRNIVEVKQVKLQEIESDAMLADILGSP